MTESTDAGESLTPEEEARVSRMLADAGGPVVMPPEVADRLEDVLAGMTRRPSSVVELRSRRRWPRALLAAAAVLVAGYGVGSVVTQGSLGGGSDASTADKAVAGSDRSGAAEDESGPGGGATALSDKEPASAPQTDALSLGPAVRLSSDRLDAGVRRALRVLQASTAAGPPLDGALRRACPPPAAGKATESLSVLYDGERAVLVAGPERDGLVEVTVYSCAGEKLDGAVVAP